MRSVPAYSMLADIRHRDRQVNELVEALARARERIAGEAAA